MTVLVLGLGQSLRGDDAAGLDIVRLWQEKYPQSAGMVRVERCENPGLEILDALLNVQSAVIVDAMQSSAPPGTLIRVAPHDLVSFASDAQSSHGWGLSETLQMGWALHPRLESVQITVIGIVGRQFAIGDSISNQVSSNFDIAVEMLEREVRSLL